MITTSPLTHGQNVAGGSTATTASISPSANQLVIVSVVNWNASSTPGTPTITGAGMTWTQIATHPSVTKTDWRITLFRALAAAPGSGALTIDFGGVNENIIAWGVDQFLGVDASGTNGANAIVQSAANDVNTTTNNIFVTLGAFANLNNATYGVAQHGGTGTTSPGSGFTQTFYQQSNVELLGEFESSNNTTVNWTWPSENNFALAMAVEIAAAPPGAMFLVF
jgi:hypothetical protein